MSDGVFEITFAEATRMFSAEIKTQPNQAESVVEQEERWNVQRTAMSPGRIRIHSLALFMMVSAALVFVGCKTPSPEFSDYSLPEAREVFKVGDIVCISFPTTNPELEHRERVQKDGTIHLPLLGAFPAAGKTATELQREVSNQYHKKLSIRPLTVSWYDSRYDNLFVYIGGEVRQPGRQAYLGRLNLSKAIQRAGDFTDHANKKKIKLIHPDGSTQTVNVVRVDGNDPEAHPGDKIEVPRKSLFGF